MKRIFIQFMFLMVCVITANAQAPQKFNYQGVARSSSGAPLVSAPIGLRLTVHDGSAGGTNVYQETHAVSTNAYGLYNVAVGGGTVVSGTFNAINWGSGGKYMEVEIDPAGGSSYTSAGTSQLLSVPYALNAANAPSLTGTSNYVAKFTSTTALGNSLIFDNGTAVGLNTITPSAMSKFHVSGAGTYGVLPYYQAGIVADGASSSANVSGIYGEGGWRGVFGRNPGTASGSEAIGVQGRCEGGSYSSAGYGLKGDATGTGPKNYGVYGLANSATTNNYGVYGSATGTGAFAGYFQGNVSITGSIAKGSGTFKIDHPLDPENKYLYHSFVESPDMMNIYNGNVVTDANGDAIVTMPEYFEALNKDFRYQLTSIGTFSQAIVAEKINGNQFKIKSDKPNVEVSWQVTGVRQDKYANAHRVVPVVEKEPTYKGHYIHAAEWGMPTDKSIDALTNPNPLKGDNTSK